MRRPVDVLAVMDTLMRGAALHADNCVGLIGKQWSHQALKAGPDARDAVAELIAADKAYDHANANRIEADNRITSGDRSDDAFRRQASAHHAYDRAVDRRRIALANMGAA